MEKFDYPIIVIGAGSAGLVIAIGAAKAGRKVLLVERGSYGGDCTHFGCIPSKTLISSAHVAHQIRHAERWGLHLDKPNLEGAGALERVRSVVQGFVSEEGPDALAEHGVDTLTGTASFLDRYTLAVELPDGSTKEVRGKNIVIATGSRPLIPPIEGLNEVPYHTNETIFDLKKVPGRLAIIGGGAIGCELAQAFRRLGSEVTLIEFMDHLIFREEPEAQELLERSLAEEGISVYLGHSAEAVHSENGDLCVLIQDKATKTQETLSFDSLLVSVGRTPNCDKLNLETVGIEATRQGVAVDRYGRTSVKNIWAVGDSSGGPQFTHWAEDEARRVLTSLLMPGPFKRRLARQPVPAVTFTDPEVARVGLTESEAIATYGASKLAIYHLPFERADRAVAAGRTDGFVKIVTKKWSSKILGATIVGERAGEMLPEIGLAMRHRIPLRKIAALVHPYPTYNQGIRRAADLWLTQTLLPALKKLTGK